MCEHVNRVAIFINVTIERMRRDISYDTAQNKTSNSEYSDHFVSVFNYWYDVPKVQSNSS
ncbi:hypothetical protein GCM10025879_17950 [Leuconostoc litchii]|nr:hypothetical protein GCM10025879_17950 [Leuconostoc litchii]